MKWLKVFAIPASLLLILLGIALPANAELYLYMTTSPTLPSSYVGTGSDTVSFSGPIGNWTTNFTTGIKLTSQGPANIDLNSVNLTSVGAGTLYIYLVGTDLWAYEQKCLFTASVTTMGSVTFAGYYNANNSSTPSAGGWTQAVSLPAVGSYASNPAGVPSSFAQDTTFPQNLAQNTTYSFMETAVISHTSGNQVTSFNEEVSAGTHMPIPGGVWLLGGALMGLIGIKRRMTGKKG